MSRTDPPPARTTSGSTPGCTGDLLAVAELLHVLEHLRGRHEPERVVVRARPDGRDDLLGLGRREDELHVLRGLLDDLEEGVEPARRDHVRLVDDEDLVAVAGRREDGPLAQIAGVVDAAVTGRVDLHHIQRPAAVAGELDARRADTARGVGRTLGAVQAAGQDAGAGRLAAAARAAEEIGVVDAVGAQRRAQRVGHLRLADQLGERLGPVAAVEGGDHSIRVVVAADPRLGSAGVGHRAARPPLHLCRLLAWRHPGQLPQGGNAARVTRLWRVREGSSGGFA